METEIPIEEQQHAYETLLEIICQSQNGGGRKYTRVRNHSSRHRRRCHAQRGGAAELGPYAQVWAAEAERLMKAKCPGASTTLRFYQLIIFIHLIHLLELDKRVVTDQDTDECKRLAKIICDELNNKDVLTAYFQCTFGSLNEAIAGMAGTAYVLSSGFPYFIQLLASVANSTIAQEIVNYAVGFVTMTLPYTGLDPRTPTGIINWGIIMHEFFNPLPPDVQVSHGNFLQRNFSTLKTLLARRIKTTTNAFLAAPEGVLRTINAAKYYARSPGAAAGDACSRILQTGLNQLVDSSKVNQKILFQLGGAFDRIVTAAAPKKAAELKCRFVTLCAMEPDLLAELQSVAQIKPNSLTVASASCPGSSPPPAAAAATFSPAAGQQSSTLFQSQPSQQQQQQQQQSLPTFGSPAQGAAAAAFSLAAVQPPPPLFQSPHQSLPTVGSTAVSPAGYSLPAAAVLGPPGNSSINSSITKTIQKGLRPSLRTSPGYTSGWGVKDKKKGGSSKHKKKHPRSTNKRKLLVKRVRRRRTTMKNKNKK